MKHLIEILWRHPLDRFVFGYEALMHHLDGDAHGGETGALGTPRLQHVQLAVLEGEFEVWTPGNAAEFGASLIPQIFGTSALAWDRPGCGPETTPRPAR
jgi:hypothetical protein